MLSTTLNAIYAQAPRSRSYKKLLAHLGKTQPDDEPVSFLTIIDVCGFEIAALRMRSAPQHGRVWRLFAVWRARQVEHLLNIYEDRSKNAINVAEKFANGTATQAELCAAEDAALAASRWKSNGPAAQFAARVAMYAANKDNAQAPLWYEGRGEEIFNEETKKEFIRIISE